MGKHKGVFLQAVSELKLFLFGSALVLTIISVVPALAQFPGGGDMGGGGFGGGAPMQQQPVQQMQPVAPMQEQQPMQQQPAAPQQNLQQQAPQQGSQPGGAQGMQPGGQQFGNLEQGGQTGAQPQQFQQQGMGDKQLFGGKKEMPSLQGGDQGSVPPGLSNQGKMPSGLENQGKLPTGWNQGEKKGFGSGELPTGKKEMPVGKWDDKLMKKDGMGEQFKLPSTGKKEMPGLKKDPPFSSGKINLPSDMSGDFEDFKFDTRKLDKKGKPQFEDFEDFDTDLGQSKKPNKFNLPTSLDQFDEEEEPKFKQPRFKQLEEIQEVEFIADDYVKNLVKGLPLIEKAQSKFESSLENATSDKAALVLAKKAASKLNSFCKYAKLPSLPSEIEIGVEGFECKAFVKEASAAVLSAIKAKDVDTAIENISIAYDGLITNFESLQSSIEAAVEAANSGEEEFEEEEEFDF